MGIALSHSLVPSKEHVFEKVEEFQVHLLQGPGFLSPEDSREIKLFPLRRIKIKMDCEFAPLITDPVVRVRLVNFLKRRQLRVEEFGDLVAEHYTLALVAIRNC